VLAALGAAVGCPSDVGVATATPLPFGPAAVSIYSAPNPSIAGQQVVVAGRVPGLGAGIRVTLWQQSGNGPGFRRVAATVTSADGGYEFWRTPGVNRAWYVTALGFQSRTVRERVQARVMLQSIAAGPAIRFAGLVSPSHAGERIMLERFAGGRWRSFARPRLDPGSDFVTAAPLSAPADVRAVLFGDDRNVRSTSQEVMTVAASLGAPSAMPPNYFGVNWDYAGAAMFSGDLPGEYTDLAALAPGNLRWPGGTAADYFQWQLGYPTDIGERNRFVDTLSDLAAAYAATGAPPVFDLNVVTSDVATQEKMLFAAQRLGLPVKYVELGNELYFGEFVQQFPTGTSYGQTVAAYVIALHRDFPGVLVAAAAAPGGGPPRDQAWNTEMLTTAAQAGGLPDAVALHIKPGWNGPIVPSELPSLFGMPYQAVTWANGAIAALPYPEPAWMTEYNLYPELASNPAQYVYAHALLVAEDALLMRGVTNAILTDYWTSFSGSPNSAYVPSPTGAPALTPAGLALEWVQSAAAGATTSAPISFGGPSLWRGGPPALVGYQFSGPRDVIVNLSSKALIALTGFAIPSGLPYKQVTGEPTEKVTYADQLAVSSGAVGSSLALPPYSITLVG
jgi:hypothetical protein